MDIDAKEGEIITGNEILPASKRPRIVIFGARASGSYDLAIDLKSYLEAHGIKNPFVDPARYVESIEHVMFGVRTDKKLPEDEEERIKGLPNGVIVLPYMRQTTESADMTIPTGTNREGAISSRQNGNNQSVYEYIKSICDKYKIPIVPIPEEYTSGSGEEIFPKLLRSG